MAGGSRRPGGGQHPQYPPNWPVLAVLRAEFEQLPPRQRLIAQAASVLDDPFDAQQVAEVADLTSEDTHAGLDGLIQRDMIRLERGGKSMHYRHPLVRDVVYRTAGRGWQQIAHTRAAEALARASAPLTHRAPHVMRVARVGDQAAVHLLTNAATVTMMTSPSTAAQWLQAALHNLPEDQVERRIELLDDLAKALQLAGRLSDSRTAYEQLLALLPFGTQQRVDAAVACSRVEIMLGRSAVARDLVVNELRRLPGDATDHLIALHVELASARVLSGEFFGVDRDQMMEVLEIARQRADRGLEATALCELAAAHMGVGDIPAALDWRRQAAEQMDSLSDDELVTWLEALTALGWTEFFLGLNEAALRHLERGLRLCQRAGKHDLLTYLLAGTAMALWDLGRIADSLRYVEDAVDAAELSGSEHLRVVAYSMQPRARLSARRPGRDENRRNRGRLGAGAAELVRRGGRRRAGLREADHGRPGRLPGHRGPCLWWPRNAADRSAAPTVFFRAGPGSCRAGPGAYGRGPRLAADHREGRRKRRRPAKIPGIPGNQPGPDRHFRRRPSGRRRVRESGRRRLRDRQPSRQRSRCVAAGWHRALAPLGPDHREAAVAALERAGELFESGGLLARRAEADAQLDLLRTPKTPEPETPARTRLTTREAEIAQLVAAGLTNPEIADRLGLRPRTVETHITNIRGKTSRKVQNRASRRRH